MGIPALSSNKMESITPMVTASETKPIGLVLVGQPKEKQKQKERVYIVDGGAQRTLYAKDLEKLEITNIKIKDTDVRLEGKFDAGKITVKNGAFQGKEVTAKNIFAKSAYVDVADITEGAKVRGTIEEKSNVYDGDNLLDRKEDATKFSGKVVPALAKVAVVAADIGGPMVAWSILGTPGLVAGFVYGGTLCPTACKTLNNMDAHYDTNFDYKAKP